MPDNGTSVETTVSPAQVGDPTNGGVASVESKEMPQQGDVEAIRRQLATAQEELGEYKSRVGRLASENDRRVRERDAKVEALSNQLHEAQDWIERVEDQSLTPEQRTVRVTQRLEARLADSERREEAERAEQQARDAAEAERGRAWQQAITSGVPQDAITHYNTAEEIRNSVTLYWERKRAEDLQSLRTEVASLREAESRRTKNVADAARSRDGGTAVPEVPVGAVPAAIRDDLDLPDEVRSIKAQIETELAKPRERRRSGKIIELQMRAAHLGYDMQTQVSPAR